MRENSLIHGMKLENLLTHNYEKKIEVSVNSEEKKTTYSKYIKLEIQDSLLVELGRKSSKFRQKALEPMIRPYFPKADEIVIKGFKKL